MSGRIMLSQQATVPQWWQVLPAIVQSVFWLTVGAVTVLTYIHAKNTVLQPLRTEVYKVQIQLMGDLIKIFAGKGEVALTEYFGLDRIAYMNLNGFLAHFVSLKFDLQLEVHDDKYIDLEHDGVDLGNAVVAAAKEGGEDEEHVAGSWYRKSGLALHEKSVEAEEEMQAFLENPLLPQACSNLIQDLLSIVEKNYMALLDTMEAVAPKIEQGYQDVESLRKANVYWIHNEWLDNTEPIEPKVKELILFVREYFASDKLKMQVRLPRASN
jgi:hypothetical protein